VGLVEVAADGDRRVRRAQSPSVFRLRLGGDGLLAGFVGDDQEDLSGGLVDV
jgi:hypothetical protein